MMRKKLDKIVLIVFAILFLSCHKEQKIVVLANFTATVVNDNTLPYKVNIGNNTVGATSYTWTFEGGDPATSNRKDPGTITFPSAGKHAITLVAANEDDRQTKTFILNLDSTIAIGFTDSILVNNFSPATVRFTNTTTGATSYSWTFQDGVPATSSLQTPPDVTFTTPGEHSVTLVASKGSVSTTLTKKIMVADALNAAFDIVPAFDSEDFQAPFTATLTNKTISGLTWQWSTTGGLIDKATDTSPTITISNPGTYTISLTANNNKTTRTVSKTITVLPNTNLATHTNIKLGINTAHSTVGSFYSTKLRRTFKQGDDLDTAGKWIDIVYFGLNQSFSYNKFISPDSVQAYTFAAINAAQPVKVINSQENCNCGVNFSATDFDNMANDSPLKTNSISVTAAGTKQWSNGLPDRIVLFQTKDGRKGAIKVKQYVAAGADSFIVVDIKVQKKP
jgi:PKD repeat protein